MAEISKRKNKSGEEVYRLAIRKKGMKSIYKTFKTEKEAFNYKETLENALQNIDNTIPPFPFHVWIDRYQEEVLSLKSKKMQIQEQKYIKYWLEIFSNEIAINISPLRIELAANEIYNIKSKQTKRNLGPTSRLHYLKCLSFIYTSAIRKWNWAKENPVQNVDQHIDKIKEHQKKEKPERRDWLELKNEFVEKCKETIKQNNYKILDLKKMTGYQKTTIQNVMNPLHNSTLESMYAFGKVLGVKLIIEVANG